MGVYSTLYVTRSKAKQLIAERLLDGVTDFELESFMDALLQPRLHNCLIVDDEVTRNDDDKVDL